MDGHFGPGSELRTWYSKKLFSVRLKLRLSHTNHSHYLEELITLVAPETSVYYSIAGTNLQDLWLTKLVLFVTITKSLPSVKTLTL